MTSDIDVFVLLYNNRSLIPAFLKSLCRIAIPVTVFFLDNNSSDGSPELLAELLPSLPFKTHLLRSRRNNGFAGGINRLTRLSQSEFIFLLNPLVKVLATLVIYDLNAPSVITQPGKTEP